MGCNVKLLFWRQICCHCSSPNFVLHVTSHVYAHPSGGFWKKEEYYTSLLHLKMYVCVCLPPFFPHLDVLSEAFKGVNIKAFLAGLQAGDNLLGFNASWSDCQTWEAAMEVLGKPRGCDLTTWLERTEDKGTTGKEREVRCGAKRRASVTMSANS